MRAPSLLRELRAVLADYQARIDRIGPETFRLRGESFDAWERKRRRIRLCLALLTEAVEADDRGALDKLLREVVAAPERHIPPEVLGETWPAALDRVAEANVAALREHLARLHRERPAACEGEGCPCRTEPPPPPPPKAA